MSTPLPKALQELDFAITCFGADNGTACTRPAVWQVSICHGTAVFCSGCLNDMRALTCGLICRVCSTHYIPYSAAFKSVVPLDTSCG